MSNKYNVLILGASYGSLLASKLLLAGHDATLVCLPSEAELINAEGIRVRMPIKGREGLVEIDSRTLPGKLSAAIPQDVSPAYFDLVALGMQEPQYRSPGVRQLLESVAKSRVPCMSIMNMPPLPYLARLPGVDVQSIRPAYAEASVWDCFDPATLTMCSPDPQAFRPPEELPNVLQVRLPTNFKAARFESEEATQMLRDLEADIQAVRFDAGNGDLVELPVKLRVYDSLYVPLAKWPMLVAGNYRCIQKGSIRSAKEAVHTDVEESKRVYDWVSELCLKLGAEPSDMVPFEKYANAALSLGSPSSAARALFAGAPFIERVDLLVKTLAAQKGMSLKEADEIVALVNACLEANRAEIAKIAKRAA